MAPQAELIPIVDLLDELKSLQKGDCIYCELGAEHPSYSVCEHRIGLNLEGGSDPFVRDHRRTARRVEVEPIRFGAENEFTLRLAVKEEDRLRGWHLVYKEYLAHGYTTEQEFAYRYSIHDALPDAATFLVEKAGQAVGTVTVFPDSPVGLPADEIYGEELDAFRALGRRPVEIGRLTIDKEFANDRTILTQLFDMLTIYARCVRGATDLVITVNPSHEKFYEKMILFERLGGTKDFGSVCGAPAVLMRLDLDLQRQMVRWVHGEGPQPARVESARRFYQLFSSEAEEAERVQWIRDSRSLPAEVFLRRYFVWVRPLIPNLSSPMQYFFEKCYPDYNLRAE